MRIVKRIMAMLLVLCVMCSLLAGTALAEEDSSYEPASAASADTGETGESEEETEVGTAVDTGEEPAQSIQPAAPADTTETNPGQGTSDDPAGQCLHSGGISTCHSPAVCEVCGEAYGEINPDNHDGGTETRDAVEATCSTDGSTGTLWCLGCGCLLAEAEVIPGGHCYDCGVCTRCGATAYDVENWDGVTVKTVEQVEMNGGSCYLVDEAAELAWIAAQVNAGDSFAGKTVRLTADINLNGCAWEPIGNGTAFCGVFDGDGFRIDGLFVDGGESGYIGLFGNNAGTVKELLISGEIGSEAAPVGDFCKGAGSTAGYNSGLISNVQTDVAIYAGEDGSFAIGGIAGENSESGKVENCAAVGELRGGAVAGGIAGRSSGVICGCFHTGDVSAWTEAGGILGAAYGGAVSDCYNTGAVTAVGLNEDDDDNSAETNELSGAGGLVGAVYPGTEAFSLARVYNTGDIAAEDGAAGALIGLLCGESSASVCLWADDCASDAFGLRAMTPVVEDLSAKTAAGLRSEEAVEALNAGDGIWSADTIECNDGYPILTWQLGLEENGAPKSLVAEIAVDGETDDEELCPVENGFTVCEYVKLDGASIYLVVFGGTPEEGCAYAYDGELMYYSPRYRGYAWLVESGEPLAVFSANAAKSITVMEGVAPVVPYDGDVNGSGGVDINDAQLICNMYDASCRGFDMIPAEKYLSADMNGSGSLTVQDVIALLSAM